MIPRAQLTAWRGQAPWPSDAQVEQDLVISRALVAMFSNPVVNELVAFRGGTALHKLFIQPPGRYSEDIDLVQLEAVPIGGLLDTLRSTLDPWLGLPKRKRGQGRVTLLYRFESTSRPIQRMRLKVEINSREHFNVLGLEHKRFEVRSRWFSGAASIVTYALDELLGTKLRALYQRKKGRDLFDLWWAARHGEVDPDRVVRCFCEYLAAGGHRVSRAEFEANLAHKLQDRSFTAGLSPLLAPGTDWDLAEAARWVAAELVARVPGEPWKNPEGLDARGKTGGTSPS